MTASTDALMAEVQANRKIGLRVQEVISPRAVTLGDGDATALVEQLKKAGYWPKAGKGIPSSPRAGAVHSTVTIKSGDLVHLLVGAMVLHHISEATGWQPPMSEALIRQLTWNLPPAVVKQVERMASEAIARYESEVGIERATEDGEE